MMIFFRFLLAAAGGYWLAAVIARLVSISGDGNPASAVMAGTLLAFTVHCLVFIGVFMVRSTTRAWLGVIVPALVFQVLYVLLKGN